MTLLRVKYEGHVIEQYYFWGTKDIAGWHIPHVKALKDFNFPELWEAKMEIDTYNRYGSSSLSHY